MPRWNCVNPFRNASRHFGSIINGPTFLFFIFVTRFILFYYCYYSFFSYFCITYFVHRNIVVLSTTVNICSLVSLNPIWLGRLEPTNLISTPPMLLLFLCFCFPGNWGPSRYSRSQIVITVVGVVTCLTSSHHIPSWTAQHPYNIILSQHYYYTTIIAEFLFCFVV